MSCVFNKFKYLQGLVVKLFDYGVYDLTFNMKMSQKFPKHAYLGVKLNAQHLADINISHCQSQPLTTSS